MIEQDKDIKYRCYRFSKDIIKFIDTIEIKKIFNPLIDQLLRSTTSIGANIIEGKAGSSKKDFINYYNIALKSANESIYWLCLIRDSFKIEKLKADVLIKELDEIVKVIATIIIKAKGGNIRK